LVKIENQDCSSCRYVDKRNRKDTQEFECKACGNKINAQEIELRIFSREVLLGI
jgi:putative transposase